MVQPLSDSCTSFCLAIMETDNKFTAKCVLLRWKHILKECENRKIHVLSVGSDSDSRLMKAMRVLFQKIPDAKATKQYVDIIECAYLNKELSQSCE